MKKRLATVVFFIAAASLTYLTNQAIKKMSKALDDIDWDDAIRKM